MDDDDFRRQNLEEPRCLGNRFSRSIHEGLRLQQQPSFASDRALRELASEAAAKARKTVPPGDRVDRHETAIVAGSGVASARIAEADDEAHHHLIADAAILTRRTQPATGCSA